MISKNASLVGKRIKNARIVRLLENQRREGSAEPC